MVELGSIRGGQMCRIMVDPGGSKETIQFSSTNVIPLEWIKTDNSRGRSVLKSRERDETERDRAVVQKEETIPGKTGKISETQTKVKSDSKRVPVRIENMSRKE